MNPSRSFLATRIESVLKSYGKQVMAIIRDLAYTSVSRMSNEHGKASNVDNVSSLKKPHIYRISVRLRRKSVCDTIYHTNRSLSRQSSYACNSCRANDVHLPGVSLVGAVPKFRNVTTWRWEVRNVATSASKYVTVACFSAVIRNRENSFFVFF